MKRSPRLARPLLLVSLALILLGLLSGKQSAAWALGDEAEGHREPSASRVQHVFTPRTWSPLRHGEVDASSQPGVGQATQKPQRESPGELESLKKWVVTGPEVKPVAAAVTEDVLPDEPRERVRLPPTAAGKPRYRNRSVRGDAGAGELEKADIRPKQKGQLADPEDPVISTQHRSPTRW